MAMLLLHGLVPESPKWMIANSAKEFLVNGGASESGRGDYIVHLGPVPLSLPLFPSLPFSESVGCRHGPVRPGAG